MRKLFALALVVLVAAVLAFVGAGWTWDDSAAAGPTTGFFDGD